MLSLAPFGLFARPRAGRFFLQGAEPSQKVFVGFAFLPAAGLGRPIRPAQCHAPPNALRRPSRGVSRVPSTPQSVSIERIQTAFSHCRRSRRHWDPPRFYCTRNGLAGGGVFAGGVPPALRSRCVGQGGSAPRCPRPGQPPGLAWKGQALALRHRGKPGYGDDLRFFA